MTTFAFSSVLILILWQGHTKGVYPMVFIPALGGEATGSGAANIHPGDLLLTGSADNSARSWSFEVIGGIYTVRKPSGK